MGIGIDPETIVSPQTLPRDLTRYVTELLLGIALIDFNVGDETGA